MHELSAAQSGIPHIPCNKNYLVPVTIKPVVFRTRVKVNVIGKIVQKWGKTRRENFSESFSIPASS
jgi:hypothetical protein